MAAAGNGPGPKPTTGAGRDQERGRHCDDLRVSHAVCPGDLLQIRIHVVDVEAGVDQRLTSRRQQHQYVGGRFGTGLWRRCLGLPDLRLALSGEAQQHKTQQGQDGEGNEDRGERNSSGRAGRWRRRPLGLRALGLSGRGSRAGVRCCGIRGRRRWCFSRGEGFSCRCGRRRQRGECRGGVTWTGAFVAWSGASVIRCRRSGGGRSRGRGGSGRRSLRHWNCRTNDGEQRRSRPNDLGVAAKARNDAAAVGDHGA